jgi:glutamate decarboxylase
MEENEKRQTGLVADWKALEKVFLRPENDSGKQTLIKYMEQILFGLHDFLNTHVGVTEEISLKELTDGFRDTRINRDPERKLAQVITDIIDKIAPKAVNVASPYFIGHMTSAIPFFMVHLKTITAALNQNVIKLETSKVFSVVEKQVLAKVHRLIYDMAQSFYTEHVQHVESSLGAFTSGGTTANLTALRVARNNFFKPRNNFAGIELDGMAAALKEYDTDRAVVLVSRRAHFSIEKAWGILGAGSRNVIAVYVDEQHRLDTEKLESMIREFEQDGKTVVAAVVGIAGTTETGSVDPLQKIGEICARHSIHFHVDAAWGGPVLLSDRYRGLLDGIASADSVTIDCHKQFYMPMTSGMVFFKDPWAMNSVAYYSNYVNRRGSVDLGIKTLEGSREANSLILDSALKIMGSRGYALMIDHGIDIAGTFAAEIEKRPLFQLVAPPELNIVTYRIVPERMKKEFQSTDSEYRRRINGIVSEINRSVQRKQRERGKSFVSRTRLRIAPEDEHTSVVLRSVLMNPMTDIHILREILDEQEEIFKEISAP